MVIKAILMRLRLSAPEYAGLVQLAKLTGEVEREVSRSGQAAEPVAYRLICQRLYAGCGSADELVRETTYQWLGGYVYRSLYQKLNNNRDLAEDLTNDTIEIVVRKLSSCHSPELFLGWVGRIAINELLQYRRKEDSTIAIMLASDEDELNPALSAAQAIGEADVLMQNLPAPNSSNPEAVALRKELVQKLVSKIESLKKTKRSERYKAILYGTYFLGKSDEESAQELNLSVQEMQKMRYQALLVLRSDQKWIDELRNG